MIKGTKLVCIKEALLYSDDYLYNNGDEDSNYTTKIGDIIYFVSEYIHPHKTYNVYNTIGSYEVYDEYTKISDHFIPLAEFREQRINKILE